MRKYRVEERAPYAPAGFQRRSRERSACGLCARRQGAKDEIYRTVFELTKEVETIKKRLAKLERSDESRDL